MALDPLDPQDAFLSADSGLSKLTADPIANFRFSSKAQRDFVLAFHKFEEVALQAGNQAGKAQPIDELVATPSGWRAIGSLKPGDAIFAGDGSATHVVGVFPQGLRPIRRITFGDGSWTRCTDEHLWTVRTHRHRFHEAPGNEVMPLADIIRRWGERPLPAYAVSIPTCSPVAYATAEQPLDPYLVGSLLGDGHLATGGVAISSADEGVLERVAAAMPAGVTLRHRGAYDYRLTGGSRGGAANPVLDATRELGLAGLHAQDKFIPAVYLYADVAQRMALLQGLMDTDGWSDRKGSCYFATTSPRLRDGLMALVRSLGGRASVSKEKRPIYTYLGERRFGRPAWTILVRLPGVRVFGLERKQARVRDSFRTIDRILVSAEACGSEQCVCISVADPSQTYLTKDFIVTHNTTIGATLFVALMRGVKQLCGDIVGVHGLVKRAKPVPLPLLGTPVSFIALAQGREMAKESVIRAVRLAVGDWPHHLERAGTAIAAIWVKPDNSRSDDWHDWSVLRFFVEEGQSVAGMRLDGAWGDEPPKWPLWLEIRMRGKANRPFLRAITFTPIDKPRWKPLKEDFKGCQVGKDGKIILRMSVYDNKALSQAHIKGVEAKAKGNLMKAKLMGDFIDVTGSNPFSVDGLKKWADRCRPPERVDRFWTLNGSPVDYEVWEDANGGDEYLVVADPSGGIEDEEHEHDPCEVVVVSRRKRKVLVRYNGYLRAGELGRLAVHLAKKYNRALVAFERNSGYGEAFYQGVGDYGELYIEHHMDSRSLSLTERIGWHTSATSRGTIISALQNAIENDTLEIWSAAAVDSLGDVVVKRDGIRIEAGKGAHDEDMIVLGFAAHYLDNYPVYWPEPTTLELARRNGMFPRQQKANDMSDAHMDW